MNPNSDEVVLIMMIDSLQNKLNDQKKITVKQFEIIKKQNSEIESLKKIISLSQSAEKSWAMALCKFCNNEFIEERFEAGYDYCLSDDCQKIGLDEREREFRKVYTPALLHKCNYFWIKKSELASLNVRSDILYEYGE